MSHTPFLPAVQCCHTHLSYLQCSLTTHTFPTCSAVLSHKPFLPAAQCFTHTFSTCSVVLSHRLHFDMQCCVVAHIFSACSAVLWYTPLPPAVCYCYTQLFHLQHGIVIDTCSTCSVLLLHTPFLLAGDIVIHTFSIWHVVLLYTPFPPALVFLYMALPAAVCSCYTHLFYLQVRLLYTPFPLAVWYCYTHLFYTCSAVLLYTSVPSNLQVVTEKCIFHTLVLVGFCLIFHRLTWINI